MHLRTHRMRAVRERLSLGGEKAAAVAALVV